MSEVVDLSVKLRERSISKTIADMKKSYGLAEDIVQEYAELMLRSPSKALQKLPEFIKNSRGINRDRAFIEAIAGGPNHDWTGPLLNIVGSLYPLLNRADRELGLRQCLDFLDVM